MKSISEHWNALLLPRTNDSPADRASTELFVDGICELDDQVIRAYFACFGSRITKYEAHRQQSINSCCFATITFNSHHTVNAILRRRPHTIKSTPVFVKRILPASVCSPSERLLPASTLLIRSNDEDDFDEEILNKHLNTFGQIVKLEYSAKRQRLLVEFADYDSADRVFLHKNLLPDHVEIRKKVGSNGQNTIDYRGTCRRTDREVPVVEEPKEQRSHATKILDARCPDLLQKMVQKVNNYQAQLSSTQRHYASLQHEHDLLKKKHEQLTQQIHQSNGTMKACPSCRDNQATISRLQDTVSTLDQRLAQLQMTSPACEVARSTPPRQFTLSRRLNNQLPAKDQVWRRSVTQSQVLTSNARENVASSTHRSRQFSPVLYKYESVYDDEQ